MSKKVAIAKSRIYKGGVFQVLLHIVEILNELGIQPDLVTLKSNIAEAEIAKSYGSNARMHIREILANVRMPYEWHFLFFNFLSRRALKQYDLIVNSTNTSFGSGSKSRTISYVHYPRKDRVTSEKKDLFDPDGRNKSFLDIRNDPFFVARAMYRLDTNSHKGETVIANSAFTRDAIVRNYRMTDRDVSVVYPPVDLPNALPQGAKVGNRVATLGRFSPDKRQMEQIEIASRLGDMEFVLMGFVGDKRYFNSCVRRVASLGLTNVRLLADAPFSQVEEMLRSSSFFLHCVRNEPFGITTVQAIGAGAIPIVHDSGGQREIVEIDQLRFTAVDEAVACLRELRDNSAAHHSIRHALFSGAGRFRSSEFRSKMKPIIEQHLRS